jgi:hypothetical protein
MADSKAADLRASAIQKLRSLEASLARSAELHRSGEQGQGHSHVAPPSQHEAYNEALRELQRAGEAIPDASIRPAITIRTRVSQGAPLQDWVSGSALHADIKRILAQVDPRP